METLRLRGIQAPSSVEKLLRDFAESYPLIPKNCYEISEPAELSPQLRRIAERESEQGRVWVCFANALNTWLFACEMSLASSRERGTPVLDVNLYEEEGGLKDSGSWMLNPLGKWQRCGA